MSTVFVVIYGPIFHLSRICHLFQIQLNTNKQNKLEKIAFQGAFSRPSEPKLIRYISLTLELEKTLVCSSEESIEILQRKGGRHVFFEEIISRYCMVVGHFSRADLDVDLKNTITTRELSAL